MRQGRKRTHIPDYHTAVYRHMEMLVGTGAVQDRMLHSPKKLNDILLSHAQYFFRQHIKRALVYLLPVKLFPSPAQHDLGPTVQPQPHSLFLHFLQHKISVGRKPHKPQRERRIRMPPHRSNNAVQVRLIPLRAIAQCVGTA